MPREVDVLIIGGGVAGSVAASLLAKNQKRVLLVDKLGGSTGQSSGAVDVAHSGCQDFGSSNYLAATKLVARQNHYHPYARADEGQLQRIDLALDELKLLAEEVQLVQRNDHCNLVVATQLGTIKPTAMVQNTQAFDLCQLKSGDAILIIGFEDLPSFDARMVSKTLKWSIKSSLKIDIEVDFLECPAVFGQKIFKNPMEMALFIDTDKENGLHQSLEKAFLKNQNNYVAHFIPPILGREKFGKTYSSLNDHKKTRVYELLAYPHSISGVRLRDSLRRGLSKVGVEIMMGEALNATLEGPLVKSVKIQMESGKSVDVTAAHIILCTGRFFSGGFERTGIRREKVFGLPLWYKDQLIEGAHVSILSRSGNCEEQPIFNCGLKVDSWFRPLDQTVKVFAQNLFAAGSSIGGYDTAVGGSGLGLAAFTGYMSAFHTLNHNFID